MLRVGQGLCAGRIGQIDETVIGAAVGQARGIHLLGQPESAVEANIDAEGIPGLQADVAAAHPRMFVIVIKVEAFALLEDGRQPAAVALAAHGQGQAGFDGGEHGDEAGVHMVAPGDVLDELLLAGLAGAQEVVRPAGGQGGIDRGLTDAFGEGLCVAGEVHQPDFSRTEIGTHPLRREQRPEAGVEAQTVPSAKCTLDQGAELFNKTLGNEVFRQKSFHQSVSTTRRPRFPSLGNAAIKTGPLPEEAPSKIEPVRFWLRHCRAALYRGFSIRTPREMPHPMPNRIRRYSRLKICATGGAPPRGSWEA